MKPRWTGEPGKRALQKVLRGPLRERAIVPARAAMVGIGAVA